MKHHKAILVALFGLALITTMVAPAHAELRFGPWVHFAPYYFPSAASGLGLCFSPEDFAPKYESPNPLRPRSDGYCPPPAPRRPVRKVAQAIPRSQISAPLAEVGQRVRPHRVSPQRVTAPLPRAQTAPSLRVNTGAASPAVAGQPLSRPQAVRTTPGNRSGAFPRRPMSPQL
jgi:hypothetical protein